MSRARSDSSQMACGCRWERTEEYGDVLKQCPAHEAGEKYDGSEPMNAEDLAKLTEKLREAGMEMREIVEMKDEIRSTAQVRWDFWDRLKIFLFGVSYVEIRVKTEHEVGATETTSHAWTKPLWRPWRRAEGMTLGEVHEPELEKTSPENDDSEITTLEKTPDCGPPGES